MKWASVPSAYRYCILRASVRTGRNFSPARKVRSITAPSAARRSFVRTNAPPLPGLTCWNSRILKTVPSMSMWLPFLNWLVLMDTIGSCGERSHDDKRPEDDGRLHPRLPPYGTQGGWLHQPEGSARSDRAVGGIPRRRDPRVAR